MSEANKYILGVDAGATKTTAIIADEKGDVLAMASKGRPANIHIHSEKEFKENIKDTIDEAIAITGHRIKKFSVACFGVAGVDTPALNEKALSIVKEIVKTDDPKKIIVYNDVKLIRSACSEKEFGVSAIAGTGSNFYGINKKGEEAYAGGLDYLLSDEGSSYWLGLNALQAAVRSADGRGPKSLLEELVLEELSIESVRELANIVYEKDFNKTKVASFSRLVDDAYLKGDKVATGLHEKAAEEIALGINAVVDRLNMTEDEFDVLLRGGVFNAPFPFQEKIKGILKASNCELKVCRKEPAEGAVKLALGLVDKK